MNDTVKVIDLGDAIIETKQPPEGAIRDNVAEFAEKPLDL